MLSEMLSIISGIGAAQLGAVLVLFVIFILFLVLMKKVIKTAINFVIIGIASAIFPFFLNIALGFRIPITLDLELFFILLGLGLYLLYIAGKLIYAALGLAEKSAKVITYPIKARSQKKEKEMKKKVEELVKKSEEKKKSGKKSAKKVLKEIREEDEKEDEIIYEDDSDEEKD